MVEEEAGEAVVTQIQGHQIQKVELEALIDLRDGVVREVQLLHGLEGLRGQKPVERAAVRPRLAVVDEAVLGQVEGCELAAGRQGVRGDAREEVLMELQVLKAHQVPEDGLAHLGDLVPLEAQRTQFLQADEGRFRQGFDLVSDQVNDLNVESILDII